MPSLHRLAGRGDPFELLAALEAGADPNEPGQGGKTPLMHAAKADNRVAARLLLKWNAEIDAVDDEGRTALLDASERKMKRLLLDAGADPDRGRIAGMTLMAFFAEFRHREWIDFLLAHGADPAERTRDGRSVREILDDSATIWRSPLSADTPNGRARNADSILKLSDDLRLTPEAYVAAHRNIMLWSFGVCAYDDPALAAWASRVSDLLASSDRLEAAYRLHLTGDTLDAALRSLVRPRARALREAERRQRDERFEALHLRDA